MSGEDLWGETRGGRSDGYGIDGSGAWGAFGDDGDPEWDSGEHAGYAPSGDPYGDESGDPPVANDADGTGPMLIAGSGVPMGDPMFGRRGEHPLTMRVAVLGLMAALLVSGLFAVTPLGGGADGSASSFQALAGAVVARSDVSYHWYIAEANDTPESLAKRFHVQVGGIYKLNNLLAGQELDAGKSYKIPYDPRYGADYRPPSIYGGGASYGATTYGDSQWTSKAGEPPPEVPCGVDGHGVPTAYQLQPPNPGSHFVTGRGFSWFHDGIDLGGPRGNPIRAAQAGEVIWAGWANDGFGFSIKINHCFHLSTAYCHLDALNVQVHDQVQPGDVIGFEGSTGWSTAPHLHFKVNVDNVAVDPLPYYGGDMNRLTGATP